MRSLRLRAIRSNVAIAKIVGKDQDEIGRPAVALRDGGRRSGEKKLSAVHAASFPHSAMARVIASTRSACDEARFVFSPGSFARFARNGWAFGRRMSFQGPCRIARCC